MGVELATRWDSKKWVFFSLLSLKHTNTYTHNNTILTYFSLKFVRCVMLSCWAPQTWMMPLLSWCVRSGPTSATRASVCLSTSGAGGSSVIGGLCHGCIHSCWSLTAWVAEFCWFWHVEPWREPKNGCTGTKILSTKAWGTKKMIYQSCGHRILICSQPPCP